MKLSKDDVKQILRDELRSLALPSGMTLENGASYTRVVGAGNTESENSVIYASLPQTKDWLDTWRRLIHEQKEFFSSRKKSFEWKFSALFQPEEVKSLLEREGFVAEEREELVAWHLGMPLPPMSPEVKIRELEIPKEMGVIQHVNEVVWGKWEEGAAHWQNLIDQKREAPRSLYFFVAEVKEKTAAVGWIRMQGKCTAGLYGGSTIPEFRKQGAFTSLVRTRIDLAMTMGKQIVTVDASPRSLPILKKLGFQSLGETTPYIFKSTP